MNFLTKKKIISWTIGILWFFPYMPVVHAAPTTTQDSSIHHHGCSSENNNTGHSMSDCIQVVHDILSQYFPSVSFKKDAPHHDIFTSGWKALGQKNPPYGNKLKIQPPNLDPPYFASQHLVGIVILTT